MLILKVNNKYALLILYAMNIFMIAIGYHVRYLYRDNTHTLPTYANKIHISEREVIMQYG